MIPRIFKLTIDGSDNLITALIAAGYKGTALLSSAVFINDNAESVYINAVESPQTAPADGTDGIPIGTGAPSISFAIEPPHGSFDGGTIWLYAATAVEIKILICGG